MWQLHEDPAQLKHIYLHACMQKHILCVIEVTRLANSKRTVTVCSGKLSLALDIIP